MTGQRTKKVRSNDYRVTGTQPCTSARKAALSVFTGWGRAKGERWMQQAGWLQIRHKAPGNRIPCAPMGPEPRELILRRGSKCRHQTAGTASVPHRSWGAGGLSKALPGVGLNRHSEQELLRSAQHAGSRWAESEEDQRYFYKLNHCETGLQLDVQLTDLGRDLHSWHFLSLSLTDCSKWQEAPLCTKIVIFCISEEL